MGPTRVRRTTRACRPVEVHQIGQNLQGPPKPVGPQKLDKPPKFAGPTKVNRVHQNSSSYLARGAHQSSQDPSKLDSLPKLVGPPKSVGPIEVCRTHWNPWAHRSPPIAWHSVDEDKCILNLHLIRVSLLFGHSTIGRQDGCILNLHLFQVSHLFSHSTTDRWRWPCPQLSSILDLTVLNFHLIWISLSFLLGSHFHFYSGLTSIFILVSLTFDCLTTGRWRWLRS